MPGFPFLNWTPCLLNSDPGTDCLDFFSCATILRQRGWAILRLTSFNYKINSIVFYLLKENSLELRNEECINLEIQKTEFRIRIQIDELLQEKLPPYITIFYYKLSMVDRKEPSKASLIKALYVPLFLRNICFPNIYSFSSSCELHSFPLKSLSPSAQFRMT